MFLFRLPFKLQCHKLCFKVDQFKFFRFFVCTPWLNRCCKYFLFLTLLTGVSNPYPTTLDHSVDSWSPQVSCRRCPRSQVSAGQLLWCWRRWLNWPHLPTQFFLFQVITLIKTVKIFSGAIIWNHIHHYNNTYMLFITPYCN